MLVFLLYLKQFQTLRTPVMGLAEMYMTFKLATSHTLDAITLIRAISDFKKPLTGLGGIDVIVKLATLDDLDNVSNLNHSIWV